MLWPDSCFWFCNAARGDLNKLLSVREKCKLCLYSEPCREMTASKKKQTKKACFSISRSFVCQHEDRRSCSHNNRCFLFFILWSYSEDTHSLRLGLDLKPPSMNIPGEFTRWLYFLPSPSQLPNFPLMRFRWLGNAVRSSRRPWNVHGVSPDIFPESQQHPLRVRRVCWPPQSDLGSRCVRVCDASRMSVCMCLQYQLPNN